MTDYFSLIDNDLVKKEVLNVLAKADGGELFIEDMQMERISMNSSDDNHVIKNSSFGNRVGFAIRSFVGDSTTLFHSNDVSAESICDVAKKIKSAVSYSGSHKKIDLSFNRHLRRDMYGDANPINELEFHNKIKFLSLIYDYVKEKSSLVFKVDSTILTSLQKVQILKSDGRLVDDYRPMISISITVYSKKGDKIEQGHSAFGGRALLSFYLQEELWKKRADEALQESLNNIDAIAAKAGEMTVVLGSGWTGVLLHEAIGHGLEGDANRKKVSAFSDSIGKKIASKDITVVDNGSIPNRRGSLNFDDEGNEAKRTVLIENGVLKGYMQDELNAKLMGAELTGNGRRESYSNFTIPRMTNTYMENGQYDNCDIISSVKNGLYATNFSGGQVDITSGDFVFAASSAYMIENGKITRPVKGATIIGNGPDVLTKIVMVGNDMKLDNGLGNCGKCGQVVPVGVGMPTVKISNITVGGTGI